MSPAELICAEAIDAGDGMIQLDVPHLVTRDMNVHVSVLVDRHLATTRAVTRLHLIADANQDPLLASVQLAPDMAAHHVRAEVRLDAPTDVRAVLECADGALMQTSRWVWVIPAERDDTAWRTRNVAAATSHGSREGARRREQP